MSESYANLPVATKRIIAGGLALFLLFSVVISFFQHWKLLSIAWVAFAAMAGGIPLGVRASCKNDLRHLIAGYGLASGAMITSAAIFLIPQAIGHHTVYGGLGIALGIISGFAIHTLNHALSHRSWQVDTVVIELTTHALTAGMVIGMVYAAMPGLSLLLGIAIVSHKAPAGYAAARRLALKKSAPLLLLIPACAVGLTAMPVSLLNPPENIIFNALLFGFATGIFFHVAIDFLPECEVGGKIHQQTHLDEHAHHVLDQYRNWAVVTTFAGGGMVFLLWLFSYY
jgi:ZIP family zinc transporter